MYNKKNVCIITTTRADYGLLKSIISSVYKHFNMNLQLIVTGSHLMEEYGETYKLIEFPITKKLYMQGYKDDNSTIIKSIGKDLYEYPDIFEELKPDVILLLGDRYEILAPSITATIMGITIFHMCGGDITEGAYDNQIRNCISMLANYHFPTSEHARQRLLSFGRTNVYLAGHPCLEKINNQEYKNRNILIKELNIEYNDTNLLIVYHQETMSNNMQDNIDNIIEFINIIAKENISIFIFGTNIDTCNTMIKLAYNKLLNNKKKNIFYFESLDQLTYLSLAKSCDVYLGNSSSGIYELPYLMDSIINIGDRQKGRELASNILCCPIITEKMLTQYKKAVDIEFRSIPKDYKYKAYNTTEIVMDTIIHKVIGQSLNIPASYI